jgi:hypothetical protein
MHYDLFLAHAGVDKDQAIALYHRLQPDVRVFLDCKSLQPGDVWPKELARAQRASLATVILLSPRADAAFYLCDEVHTAIALHRAHPDEHRAVPVYLDGIPRDPTERLYGLRALHGIDLPAEGGMDGVAARLRELVAKLRTLPPPSPPPTMPPPAPESPTAGTQTHAPVDPTALYERLTKLNDSQFETLLFHAGLPRAHIHPNTATLAQRALDAVLLVQQGGPELAERVLSALGRVAPWMK